MSKMKELSAVLDELVTCGETLINTANALKDIFSSDADTPGSRPAPADPAENATKPAPSSKNAKKPSASKSEPATTKADPEQKTEPEPLTKEAVRGILAAKSAEGYGDEIRALLKKYGAKQLKQVDPKDYAALVEDAETIGASTGTQETGSNAGTANSGSNIEATAAEEDSDE